MMKNWFCNVAVLAVIGLVLVGCGESDDTTPAPGDTGQEPVVPSLSGKADDGLSILDAGRFLGYFGSTTARFDGDAIHGWRFQAWPGMSLTVEVESDDFDPLVIIEGPIPGWEMQVVDYDYSGTISMRFEEAGVYRILVTSEEQLLTNQGKPGTYGITYGCFDQCQMPEISLGDFLAELREDLGEEAFQTLLSEAIPSFFPDRDLAAAVLAQVDAVLADPSIEVFPVVPLALAGSASQGLFESVSSGATRTPPERMDVTLSELLERDCVPSRATLAPVHQAIPELKRGSWADYTIRDCFLQMSQDVADVLNNLSLENGSVVRLDDRGSELTSVAGAFEALMESGHHVIVENSRYFANFLGLWYKDRAVQASVWLDSGVPLPGTDVNFTMPSPHTHHNIYIRGPVINADIMYYMGTDAGTSFRAIGSTRPPWVGSRTQYTYTSDRDAGAIVTLMDTAAKLRKQWTEQGASLPAEGYGLLGVCNDSTAVLEAAVESTVTIWPLATPPVESPQTQVDELLSTLPNDLHRAPEPADVIRRALLTVPFEDSADIPFRALRQQVEALSQVGAGR